MEQNLVSIIIPVYNVEKYLEECLESVINQTYKYLEIICINDCSIDDSLEIVKEYRNKDKRISLIDLENNKGQGNARNIGLKKAKGKYIYFLDSDDYIKLNTIEKLVEVIETNNIDIIHFDAKLKIDIKGGNFKNNYIKEGIFKSGLMQGKDYLKQNLKKGINYASVCRFFYKREFLIKNKILFSKGFHEDELFSFEVLYANPRVYILNEIYFIRRYREGSIMTKRKEKKHLKGILNIIELLIEKRFNETNNIELIDYKIKLLTENFIYVLKDIESQDVNFNSIDNKNKILIEIRKKLNDRKIIIYGAGKVAKRNINILVENNIEVDSIFVTKKEKNRLYGYKIYELNEVEKEKDCIIIISIKDLKSQKEIQKNLEEKGYKNIILWG